MRSAIIEQRHPESASEVMPLLAIVILNTNRKDDTIECLHSISQSTYANELVIVLDNQSTDGSVQAIESRFPEVEIIRLSENWGYAGNNNVGIERALEQKAEWILVLNEDTTLAPDCLQRMVSAGESDPHIGIVGPLVYHNDEPDVIQSAGGVLTAEWNNYHIGQNELERGRFSGVRDVDWVSGCAILVRRKVIDQVGMLDPRFFYYWEETEWCLRARLSGWRIAVVSEAKLWHKGVQRNYQPGPMVTYYSTRNRLLMMSKHRAPVMAWISALGQSLRTVAAWTLRPKWRHMAAHRRAMWRGLRDFMLRRWGKGA